MIDILRLNSEGKLESDVEYFVRLMNIEQSIVSGLQIPKKKIGVSENERDYFNKCMTAEEEQTHEHILKEINDIVITLPLASFIERNAERDTIDNDYYFRIISVEKIIKRNDPKVFNEPLNEYIERINTIVYQNNKLQAFLIGLLKDKYNTYYNNPLIRNDIINSAYTEFYSHICRYNGKYDLTTFARNHVIKGIADYITIYNGKTSYSNEIYNKIRKEITRLMSLGYSESEASSVSKLMDCESLKDLSASTISATLKQHNTSQMETFNPDYQTGMNEKFSSPEDEAIKQEKIALFNKIFGSLKAHQQFLLYACNGEINDVDTSTLAFGYNQDLIEALKKDGMYNVIKKDADGKEYVKKDIINSLYQITLKEARNLSHSKYTDKVKEQKDFELEKYGSCVINSNYEMLTQEDEDIIFAL